MKRVNDIPEQAGDEKSESGSVSFSYSISYDEAYAAFKLLSNRIAPKYRTVISIVLIGVAVVLIALYAINPYNLEYFLLPALCLALYMGIVYYPETKARSGARKVASIKGVYKIELFASGYIKPFGEQKLPLSNDKWARAFETEALFALRPDRTHTFCLPKRIMSEEQAIFVRQAIISGGSKFLNVKDT